MTARLLSSLPLVLKPTLQLYDQRMHDVSVAATPIVSADIDLGGEERLLRAARRLAESGCVDEADTVLATAHLAFPGVSSFLVERAHMTTNPVAAAAAWARVRMVLPDDSQGYIQGPRLAREAGHREEAKELLAISRERCPDDAEIVIESGWLAHVQRDWPQAAHWWKSVGERTPWHSAGYINGANCSP